MKTLTRPEFGITTQTIKVAEAFKDTLTKEQYETLKHNQFTIEDKDKVIDDYRGCGCGWAEINKDGEFMKLRYAHSLNDEGSKEQNCNATPLTAKGLEPKVLKNGNVRFLVNFSNYMLLRF